MREDVPNEEFEVVAREVPGQGAQFELLTKSPRAMIAWAELNEAVSELQDRVKNPNEINDL